MTPLDLGSVPVGALSSEAVLEHFGVKGMRWGVRKTDAQFAKSERLREQSLALQDKKPGTASRKLAKSGDLRHAVTMKVMNQTTKAARKDLSKLRKRPEFQNINYKDASGRSRFDVPKFKALEKAESDIWVKHLNNTVSGYKFDVKVSGGTWNLVPQEVKHAATAIVRVKPIRDKEGFLIDVELVDFQEDSMAQSDLGSVPISALSAEGAIEHFGVKGMRWGVRKTPSVVAKPKNYLTKGQTAALLTVGPTIPMLSRSFRENLAKNQRANMEFQEDKKWEKDFQKSKSFGFDDQKFTKDYNGKWKDHDFSKEDWDNPSPTYQKYIDGYFKEMNTAYAQQFAEHYGSSPSGKYEAVHDKGTDQVKLRRKDAVRHSLEDGVLVTFKIILDDDNKIAALEKMDDTMTQSDFGSVPISSLDLGSVLISSLSDQATLEHFGIKGMRWGVRKERPAPTAVTPSATSKVPHGKKRKTKIQTEGGENHPAHDDAIKVAVARAKLNRSGTAALSNQELREVANRLQLEAQVATLTTSRGQKFVMRELETSTQQLTKKGVKKGVKRYGPGVAKKAGKAAATVAVTAVI